jgi:serine/threonine protein kinase
MLLKDASPGALAREAEVLQLLQPNPFVIGYYGSYNGNLVLEHCSHGTLSDYCNHLLEQMAAEGAVANPAVLRAMRLQAAMAQSACDAPAVTGAADPSQPGDPQPQIAPSSSRLQASVSILEAVAELAGPILGWAQALEPALRSIMYDALYCLGKLHTGLGVHGKPGVVVTHNDLRPENMLLTSTGRLRLADWGLGHVTGGAAALASQPPKGHSTW